MKKLVDKLKYILVVPDTFEPDDLRRRRVLNDILLFLALIVLVVGILEFWNDNPVALFQQD